MKLLTINESNYGSTGRIMHAIAKASGCDFLMAVSNSRSNKKNPLKKSLYIGNRISRNIHLKLFQYTGLNGCFSVIDTLLFLKKINDFKPDIIHLHNLHNCYINLPLLFAYLKHSKVRVIWTLHDCWSFTGQCPHFLIQECDKWKTGCYDCKCFRQYPATRVDRTALMWNLKKRWFTGLKNITIVTPSQWLSEQVKNSYLGKYENVVINNGVDTSIFRYTTSDFRDKHNISADAIVLLGVSFEWTNKKGLNVFCELANRLKSNYCIVLVGTDDEIDKILPNRIISIHRTADVNELAEIYSAADIFINPTQEDTFPTVNMEAICCGTKVITYDIGGCRETINKQVGKCIPANRMDLLIEEIEKESLKKLSKEDYDDYRNLHDISVSMERYKELFYE